jgi:predicted metallo-beta-lactamase superfamily hydrolase
MATYVETDDLRLLVDPGVSLAPLRYGLEPHPLEWRRLHETWGDVRSYAEVAEALIVTHYHYDHHDPAYPELYRGKMVFIKSPKENINRSQRGRAAIFLERIRGLPKRLEVADGRSFQIGGTVINFSRAVCHGTDPRLGYVVEVSIRNGGEGFLHTSDVEGASLPEQVEFILRERPQTIFIDGPMTYMLGYRYSHESLEHSNRNIARAIKELDLRSIVLDHHFLRDLNYRERIEPVYEAAEERGIKVQTAAEFSGRKIEMLEANRRELYERGGI